MRIKKNTLFYGWWIVAISMLGISAGIAPFVFASLGVFMLPLHNEFGWTRAEISLLFPVLVVSLMIVQPFLGNFIDRVGTRRVLIPSLIAFGFGLAAIPTLVSELWHLALIFLFFGTAGAAANTLPYMKTLSSWFNARRGLAIGISVSGIGVGYAYVPLLVQFVIDGYGWRFAYYTLSAIVLCIVVPLTLLVIKDSPQEMGLEPDGMASSKSTHNPLLSDGLSAAQARKTMEFWLLSFIFLCIAFVLHGILPHLVPMLVDKGVDSISAVKVASVMGITVFVSRILIGYLVDRFFAPHVALIFFALSIIGFSLFLLTSSLIFLYLAAVMVGLSLGAEIDLLAYLAGKYFGLHSFGEIYGLLFIGVLVGTATGPVAFGFGFEATGSYSGILTVAIFINLIALLLTTQLRRYPSQAREVDEAIAS